MLFIYKSKFYGAEHWNCSPNIENTVSRSEKDVNEFNWFGAENTTSKFLESFCLL